MDDAEVWLRENDPNYETASMSWVHLRETGEYRGPRDEVPWGDIVDLELAVLTGGVLVEHGPNLDRACVVCNHTFVPREAGHQYCGDTCRAKARRDYQRAYKRDYMRRRRKAA